MCATLSSLHQAEHRSEIRSSIIDDKKAFQGEDSYFTNLKT
jgi:hypothetical protein